MNINSKFKKNKKLFLNLNKKYNNKILNKVFFIDIQVNYNNLYKNKQMQQYIKIKYQKHI